MTHGVVYASCEDCRVQRMFLGSQDDLLENWAFVEHGGHRTHIGPLGVINNISIRQYFDWLYGMSRSERFKRFAYSALNKL